MIELQLSSNSVRPGIYAHEDYTDVQATGPHSGCFPYPDSLSTLRIAGPARGKERSSSFAFIRRTSEAWVRGRWDNVSCGR